MWILYHIIKWIILTYIHLRTEIVWGLFNATWIFIKFLYVYISGKKSYCLIWYLADAFILSNPCGMFPERSKLFTGPLTLLLACAAELSSRAPTCAKTVTLLLNSCWYDGVELKQETNLAAWVLPSALSLTLAEELWQIQYKWKCLFIFRDILTRGNAIYLTWSRAVAVC